VDGDSSLVGFGVTYDYSTDSAVPTRVIVSVQ